MNLYEINVQVRWADLDPNFHLRHSVYYDWGALSRISFLEKNGLTSSVMTQLHFGPIIFREECIFRREIRLDDKPTIDLSILKGRKDFSRWSIVHTIRKNADTVAAILTCEGAWLDTHLRKLAPPPAEVFNAFSKMPMHKDFVWEDKT